MTAPVSLKRSAAITAMLAILLSLLVAAPASAATASNAQFEWSNAQTPRLRADISIPSNQHARIGFRSPSGVDTEVLNRCNFTDAHDATVFLPLPPNYEAGTWQVVERTGGNAQACNNNFNTVLANIASVGPVLQQAVVRDTSTVVPGSRINYRAVLTAWGASATGTSVSVTFPAGTTEWQTCVTGTAGHLSPTLDCSANADYTTHMSSPVTLNVDPITAAASVTRTVRFRVRVPSSSTADVGPASSEITASNSSFVAGAIAAGAVVTPAPSADLRLNLTKQNGNPARWTATIRNHGPSDVPSATLEFTAGSLDREQFTYCIGVGCDPTQGAVFPEGGIDLGAMPNGDTRTVRVAGGNGGTSLTLTVTSPTADPIPANNQRTAS